MVWYSALAALPIIDDVLPTSSPQADGVTNDVGLPRVENAILVLWKGMDLQTNISDFDLDLGWVGVVFRLG